MSRLSAGPRLSCADGCLRPLDRAADLTLPVTDADVIGTFALTSSTDAPSPFTAFYTTTGRVAICTSDRSSSPPMARGARPRTTSCSR